MTTKMDRERKRLVRRRQKLGAPLRRLAPYVEVSYNTLCRWENGIPEVLNGFKIRAWREGLDALEQDMLREQERAAAS
jgi:hypothetical protein